jgi:hypothetical protein
MFGFELQALSLGIKSKHKKGNDLSAAPGSNVHRRKGKT